VVASDTGLDASYGSNPVTASSELATGVPPLPLANFAVPVTVVTLITTSTTTLYDNKRTYS
jgi:hypothetical protein